MADMNGIKANWTSYFSMKIKGSKIQRVTKLSIPATYFRNATIMQVMRQLSSDCIQNIRTKLTSLSFFGV
jgi:hypothetical protein